MVVFFSLGLSTARIIWLVCNRLDVALKPRKPNLGPYLVQKIPHAKFCIPWLSSQGSFSSLHFVRILVVMGVINQGWPDRIRYSVGRIHLSTLTDGSALKRIYTSFVPLLAERPNAQ